MFRGGSWGGFARHLVPDAEGGRRFQYRRPSGLSGGHASYLTGASAVVRRLLLMAESNFSPSCVPPLAKGLLSVRFVHFQTRVGPPRMH